MCPFFALILLFCERHSSRCSTRNQTGVIRLSSSFQPLPTINDISMFCSKGCYQIKACKLARFRCSVMLPSSGIRFVLNFVFYFRCILNLVCVMVSFSIPAYIIVWKKVMAFLRTVSLLQDPPKSARRSSLPTFFSSTYLMFTNKNIVESVLCNIQIL